MATDFVHSEEIIDAVIAVLKGADGDTHTGGLPANWFADTRDGDEAPLELLEHGDVADMVGVKFEELLPAILVRGLGPQSTGQAGTSGVLETEEPVRVVHVRHFDQCYDSSGERELNMTRARGRYAKTIGKALMNDPHKKLATIDAEDARSEVSLTCSDGAGAQVYDVGWAGWDFGYEIGNPASTEDVRIIRALPARIWAVACDLRVRVRTGGAA